MPKDVSREKWKEQILKNVGVNIVEYLKSVLVFYDYLFEGFEGTVRVTKLSSTELERHQLHIEQQKGASNLGDKSSGYESMAWTSAESMSEVTVEIYFYGKSQGFETLFS